MKIQKRSSNEERLILIGMIVDITVLGRISSKWWKDMFKSKWANIVARWCVSFYHKYEDVPMNQIESLFESWSSETNDKQVVSLVEKFLDTLSEEYENLQTESNSDYILDMAGVYFNRVRVERLADTIQGDVDRGKIVEAVNRVLSFNQVEMGVGEGIDILQNTEAMKEAFKEQQEDIIKYPGALGNFFKGALVRDSFIAFMGPDKVGKSYWLQDMAFRGMTQRKKIAFFEAGDNSENQIMRRLMIRVAHHPRYASTIEYPTSIEKDGEYSVEVETERKKFKDKLSWQKARKACKKLMKRKIKSKSSYFRLSCHFNSTLTVSAIKDTIQNWAREDWLPDVIIIDYADILDMGYSKLEDRDRINETWKHLRFLSQMFHCLVVTATQSDTLSYNANIITKRNFSGDKRKNAHVTGMVGLNQKDPEEKEIGVTRLNWVVMRERAFSVHKCVYVAGCLAIANPVIRSTY